MFLSAIKKVEKVRLVLTRNPSSLTKIVDVPPCRAYVCIAFLRDKMDGALSTIGCLIAQEKGRTHKTASKLSL